MGWAEYQRLRIAQDQFVMRGEHPGFGFYNLTGRTYISGPHISNTSRRYDVLITLPAGYPDECPSTYVTGPNPLRDWRGKLLEAYGTNAKMHVWQTDFAGWVKICTFRPESWNAAISLNKVTRKALLWLAAYECHLDDGSPLSRFLLEA